MPLPGLRPDSPRAPAPTAANGPGRGRSPSRCPPPPPPPLPPLGRPPAAVAAPTSRRGSPTSARQRAGAGGAGPIGTGRVRRPRRGGQRPPPPPLGSLALHPPAEEGALTANAAATARRRGRTHRPGSGEATASPRRRLGRRGRGSVAQVRPELRPPRWPRPLRRSVRRGRERSARCAVPALDEEGPERVILSGRGSVAGGGVPATAAHARAATPWRASAGASPPTPLPRTWASGLFYFLGVRMAPGCCVPAVRRRDPQETGAGISTQPWCSLRVDTHEQWCCSPRGHRCLSVEPPWAFPVAYAALCFPLGCLCPPTVCPFKKADWVLAWFLPHRAMHWPPHARAPA